MPTNEELDEIVPDNNIGYEDKIKAFLASKAIKNTLSIDLCGSQTVIDHAHHEIHEGDYWFADDISDLLGSGDIRYYLFKTPNEDKFFHSFPQFYATGEFEIQVYEGATVATNGTELPLLNRNRLITSTTTFKFYKNPTSPVVTSATVVRNGRFGAGKAIGESRSENELILKKNTNYLIKLTSRVTSNYITTHMNGYICSIGG